MEREAYHSRAGDAIGRLGFNTFIYRSGRLNISLKEMRKVVVLDDGSKKIN